MLLPTKTPSSLKPYCDLIWPRSTAESKKYLQNNKKNSNKQLLTK